ncbi:MAG: ABC transporter ATP-binding protein/permease [Lachnospiraceae bacterium]|nr:ABC transporter ATP-binding protein/permease [Lachnospiraceae bacterium]
MNIINQRVFDEVFYNKNISFLFDFMIYVIITLFAISILLGLVNKYLSIRLYTKTSTDLKRQYYDDILISDMLILKNRKSSDLHYRMFSDVNAVCKYVLDIITTIPIKILYMILCTLILFSWSGILTITFYGLTFINLLCVIITKKYMKNIYEQKKKIEQDLSSKIYEDFDRIELTRAFGIEPQRKRRMQGKLDNFTKFDIKNSFIASLLVLVDGLAFNIWGVISVIVGAFLVYNEALSVGQFITFVAIAATLSSIILSLLNFIFIFPTTKISYQRIKEYTNSTRVDENERSEKFSFNKKIEIRDLSFKYPNSKRAVLKNVNLSLKPGEIVCITGENGIGKTTLQSIIAKIIEDKDFDIYIDETKIQNIANQEFRKNLAYASQETYLFYDTILSNIVLDRENIDTGFIELLIKRLYLDNIIELLPNKLNTIIGDNGYQLSLGSSQKIAIIRTLANKPRIAIFDEPTANLDQASTKSLLAIFEEYKIEHNALIIIVSHDKALIELADRKIEL